MPVQLVQQFAVGQIPNADQMIVTGGSQPLAVPMKADGRDHGRPAALGVVGKLNHARWPANQIQLNGGGAAGQQAGRGGAGNMGEKLPASRHAGGSYGLWDESGERARWALFVSIGLRLVERPTRGVDKVFPIVRGGRLRKLCGRQQRFRTTRPGKLH
jgi:hypothetical protein